MKNRIKNIALSYGTDMLIVIIVFAAALPFLNADMANARFVLLFFILWLAFLPLINYFHDHIDSWISPIRYEDLFSKTVEAVLNMKTLDDILKETFVQILDFMNVGSGMLIFYYPDRDEYSIFYQKDKRRKMIRNANIENNNAIFRALKSPDDILIKSKLSAQTESGYVLIREMDKLHAETIVPIFFRETFLGAIVTGRPNSRRVSLVVGPIEATTSRSNSRRTVSARPSCPLIARTLTTWCSTRPKLRFHSSWKTLPGARPNTCIPATHFLPWRRRPFLCGSLLI